MTDEELMNAYTESVSYVGHVEPWRERPELGEDTDEEMKALVGGPGSGNFGHAGRPGEVGGSSPESNLNFASDPKLAAESEVGIAAVEKLMDRAVAEAEYTAAEPEHWEDLTESVQDKVYMEWEQDQQENFESDGEIYNEVKKEQIDEIHADDAFDEKVYEKVKAQLAENGLKLGDEDFDTKSTIPDHYSESETGHPELKVDNLKHADGTPLTQDEQLKVKNEWDNTYEDHFEREVLSRMEDKQDHIWEMESQAASDQASEAWGNMSDAEKLSIASNTSGFNKWSQTLRPGLPDKWVTGVDPDESTGGENYARSHAIALKLAELRTDEIKKERGLVGAGRDYEIKEQVRHPSYTGDKHYSIINKATGEVIGASNSIEQAEVNARAWQSKGNSTPQMIRSVWEEWKQSSTSDMGLAFQLATANELGGVHRMNESEINRANNAANMYGGINNVQAYVRAQWEVTQTVMSKAGEEQASVYRGLFLPGETLKGTTQEYYDKYGTELHVSDIRETHATGHPTIPDVHSVAFKFYGNEYNVKQEQVPQFANDIRDLPPAGHYPLETAQQTIDRKLDSLSGTGGVFTKLPDLALKRAGAQSTAGDKDVANDWAGVGKLPVNPVRVVLRVQTPRTSVISLPVYGQNSQEEHEVVLAGTRDRWSWDVWKKKAPDFSAQPIKHKKVFKAAESRMLVAKILIDMQDIERGQPHWLSDLPDSVVLRARKRRKKLKALVGGPGSGNFGHVGRPGEIGGSGKGVRLDVGVPKEPGTTPIPPGMVRGYHYTNNGPEALKSILKDGLLTTHAKGSTYGEPNVIWMSTDKPGDFKHYVEVLTTPDELKQAGLGGPHSHILQSDGSWKRAETPEEIQQSIDVFNAGSHNFASTVDLPPSRIVTHSEPWTAQYHAIANDDSYQKTRAKIVAGGSDAFAAAKGEDMLKTVAAIKANFDAEGKRKLRTAGGPGSGRYPKGSGAEHAITESLAMFAQESQGSLRERVVIINRQTGAVLADYQQELELTPDLRHEATKDSGFSNADMFVQNKKSGEAPEYHPDGSILHLHTHPIDESFSDGDWRVFSRSTIGEMRVITPAQEFRITKTPEFTNLPWTERTPAKMQEAWDKHENEAFEKLYPTHGNEKDFVHRVIMETTAQVADQFHIIYSNRKYYPKTLGGPGSGRYPKGSGAADDLISGRLSDDLENATSAVDIQHVLDHYGATSIKIRGDVVPNLFMTDTHVIEWDGTDEPASYTQKEEWVNNANVDEYFPDYEDKLNEEFWSSGGTVYHATPDENANDILVNGIEARGQTRGMSNRSEGSAVYTTTDIEETALGSYGDTVFAIDIGAMAKDGYKPYTSQEPDVVEGELRGTLAYVVGLHDYNYDVESGMSPYTIAIHGAIPAKYITKLD